MGAVIQACFNASKALKASSVSNTYSDFLLAPSPSQMFAEWLSNACEPFDEPPVVAHQTKKSMHFCVSLRQHPSLSYWVTPHPLRLNVLDR